MDQSVRFLDERVQASIGTVTKHRYNPYYADIFDCTLMANPDGAVVARAFGEPDQGGLAAPVSKCMVTLGGDQHGYWARLNRQREILYSAAGAGYGALCLDFGGCVRTAPMKE